MRVVLSPSYAEKYPLIQANKAFRAEVQKEINQNKIVRDIREFVKTDEDRKKLKKERVTHAEAIKDPNSTVRRNRNELLSLILQSKTPRWGSALLSEFKY